MKLFAFALLAAVTMITPAFAAPSSCDTLAVVTEQVKRRIPGVKMVVLSGTDAKVFMAAFNAEPPVTTLLAEEVLVIDNPNAAKTIILVLFNGGCSTRSGLMTREEFMSYMLKVVKGGA